MLKKIPNAAEIGKYLIEIAQKESTEDDNSWEIPTDNFDDTYYSGSDAGEIQFARYLLERFFETVIEIPSLKEKTNEVSA